MKEPIHFAHGNGFPSLCYSQLFNALSDDFDCFYIDKVGHNPGYPVTENWPFLVEEVLDSIKQQINQPVIAVGHSLGGVLSLLAAIREPSLFKAVVMLDSPLLGRLKSSMLRLAKVLGFIDHITPAFRTRGRRRKWPTQEQLLAYLKDRPLFRTFSKACLQDYIDYGLYRDEEGYHLVFDSHIEYQIYRTIPHHLHQYAGQLTVPTALIYGAQSNVVDRFDVRYMKTHYHIDCFKMRGTHMLPMERPKLTARQVIQALDVILKK
ncbi:alpha/beta fold hydrolase [Legionella sp. MW5194]|uniref:alpha/beta fold hydrolase n=1 Tax=Legionella sp. MW5194 TaxID=2662448 RepID=UPI00193D2D35|nr:alpha/beta hydrolase [Legionella sp. MW5194]QRN03663.1 alpha/beta fold hydrolase [Legionella sp. MW5194]